MAAIVRNFTTGPATMPDVGKLEYNGCVFSPLFVTTLSGVAVKDNARRTVKYMEYVLEVDGYVTGPDVMQERIGISPTMGNLEFLLSKQGGKLIYEGRGFNFTINTGVEGAFNFGENDVAWGPIPEVLDFQPLGAGRSAKIRWRVTIHVAADKSKPALIPKLGNAAQVTPLLQFNCGTTVTYGEDYRASMSIRGTMEIPLSRVTQANRSLKSTVDDVRTQLDARIFAGIDLARYRVTRRNYDISRDKRVMEFDVQLEEKPYMDLPPFCTIARGTFSFRPARAGMGLCLWLCTLRCSYTVALDQPRRVAWEAFLALLRIRMDASERGHIPALGGNQNPVRAVARRVVRGGINLAAAAVPGAAQLWNAVHKQHAEKPGQKAFLIDFSGEEGVYLDSTSTSFSASWRLTTTFGHILLASGLWRKVPEKDAQGNNLWATSVRGISGSKTWASDKLDPALDVIVDFGG